MSGPSESIRAAAHVEALERYTAPLEGRRGLVRLDFNENTEGPSPRVLEAIRALPADAYATYPEYSGLDAAYARSLGIAAENVRSFNGADAGIRALFDAFGEPGTELLTTAPTFGYYRPCAELARMKIRAVAYHSDLSFPFEGIREALGAAPRICILCNPNNPTGTLIAPERILELAEAAPKTLFAVDEIYEPFTGESVLPAALGTGNVFALRSLSKGAGLSALRIGFACGPASIVERLARVTGPYDINQFAVVAALAALEDRAHVDRYVALVREAKEYTLTELSRLGVRHYSGGGNYLLVWPPGDVATVEAALRARGVLVRSMKGKPLIGESFRLSVGTPAEMRAFFDAFTDVIAGAKSA